MMAWIAAYLSRSRVSAAARASVRANIAWPRAALTASSRACFRRLGKSFAAFLELMTSQKTSRKKHDARAIGVPVFHLSPSRSCRARHDIEVGSLGLPRLRSNSANVKENAGQSRSGWRPLLFKRP